MGFSFYSMQCLGEIKCLPSLRFKGLRFSCSFIIISCCFVGLKMLVVAPCSSDIQLNLLQVPVSPTMQAQDLLLGLCSSSCICMSSCFVPDQWLFTSCLRKFPLLRPFVSLGLNSWWSESCVITEHSDSAHLAAFPSLPLPPHLPLSFLPTFLSHTGNSAACPLMWSNSAVRSSYLHTQHLMLLLFVF